MVVRLIAAGSAGLALGMAVTTWYVSLEMNTLKAENAALTEQSAGLKRAYAGVLAASLAVQAANLRLTTERDKHKQVAERQKQSLVKFSTRLAGRTSARLTKELVVVAGRSAPVAGAVVNAGMFALTLADACLTIKELNDLLTEDGEKISAPSVCGIHVPARSPATSAQK